MVLATYQRPCWGGTPARRCGRPLAAWCSADLPLPSVMWIRFGFAWYSFSTSSRRPFTAAYNIQHDQCFYLKLEAIGGLMGPPSLETKLFLILYGFFFWKIWKTPIMAAPYSVGPMQKGDNLICNSCNHHWSSEKKPNLFWALAMIWLVSGVNVYVFGRLFSHCSDEIFGFIAECNNLCMTGEDFLSSKKVFPKKWFVNCEKPS